MQSLFERAQLRFDAPVSGLCLWSRGILAGTASGALYVVTKDGDQWKVRFCKFLSLLRYMGHLECPASFLCFDLGEAILCITCLGHNTHHQACEFVVQSTVVAFQHSLEE